MKKALSICLICLLVVGLGSAYAQEDASGNTVPSDVSGDLLLWMGSEPLAYALIEGFTAKYPHVNVTYEMVGLDAISRLSLDGPSGIGPDVIAIGDSAVSGAVADGLLEPYPDDLKAKVEAAVLESALSTSFVDGKVYATPYSMEPVCFFYNKDLVDGPPESFEELIAFAKTYNDPSTGKYAMRWQVADAYHNYIFLSAFGWQVMGPAGDDWKNPGFDSPEVTAGLNFYKKMKAVFDFGSTDGGDYNATVGAFQRGITPYLISGPWAIAGCQEAGLNFGTSKFPTINGVQPRSLTATQVVAVSSYAKNFDAAFAFAEYMASVEAADMTYRVYGAAPAIKDTSKIHGLAEDDVIKGMAEQAAYTDHVPTIPEVQYLWEPWTQMDTFVWDDSLPVEEAQKKAMETYELLLNAAGLSMYND